MSALSAEHLRVAIKGRSIVDDVTLTARSGEILGIVGPNGSGKSTVLGCLAGLVSPTVGEVRLGTMPIAEVGDRAIQLAIVEQSADTDTDLRVSDVVGLGRIPHRSRWSGASDHDAQIVAQCLDRVGLSAFADRRWSTLSGGEKQRAHIARAFAQQPSVLLLDEPTNHLDIRHQFELMDLLAAADQAVVVVLHDLALAATYCDRVVMLDAGLVVASGTPAQVFTTENIARVFGVDASLEHDGSLRLIGVHSQRALP
jgi:iron complex transport system ATP-binding protein